MGSPRIPFACGHCPQRNRLPGHSATVTEGRQEVGVVALHQLVEERGLRAVALVAHWPGCMRGGFGLSALPVMVLLVGGLIGAVVAALG